MDGTLLSYGFFGAVQADKFLCRPLSANVMAINMKPYKSNIIVDPNFGELIFNIPPNETLWVIDSKNNHSNIQELRNRRKIIVGCALTYFQPFK
jgi:hypothetical protein